MRYVLVEANVIESNPSSICLAVQPDISPIGRINKIYKI